MKTIKIFSVTVCAAIMCWLLVSFIDVNMHNSVTSTGDFSTWNAWVMLADIMDSSIK